MMKPTRRLRVRWLLAIQLWNYGNRYVSLGKRLDISSIVAKCLYILKIQLTRQMTSQLCLAISCLKWIMETFSLFPYILIILPTILNIYWKVNFKLSDSFSCFYFVSSLTWKIFQSLNSVKIHALF